MKILIVDDDKINLLLFMYMLVQLFDISISICFDVYEVLDWCGSYDLDLILLDYMMLGMDGFDFFLCFCVMLGQEMMLVIMIIVDMGLQVWYKVLQMLVNDFLLKLVNWVELLVWVKNMLVMCKLQLVMSWKIEDLFEEVEQKVQQSISLVFNLVDLFLCVVGYCDLEMGEYLVCMFNYICIIVVYFGLFKEEQDLLLVVFFMYDIGKMGIFDYILFKFGWLDEEELKVMCLYVQIGVDILCGSLFFLLQIVFWIVEIYYEKWDGSGYFNGIKGDDIFLYGCIVVVVDVFDVLIFVCFYKKGWSLEDVVCYLCDNVGSYFDLCCVEVFFVGWEEVVDIYNCNQDGK